MKRSAIGITASVLLILAIVAVVFFLHKNKAEPAPLVPVEKAADVSDLTHFVIGKSAEGRDIDAYTYGTGDKHLEFVGGIHGGYEWNSVVLAYQMMDYFTANPDIIPPNITVTIIPSLNPDGVYKVTGKEGRISSADIPVGVSTAPGRFNAHDVDLNRNFDCEWQPQGTWQNKKVSAGSAPFSEPEAAAFRDFVLKDKPAAAIFWHSQSGTVYASQCTQGILPQTLDIMNLYAKASGYAASKTFDAYATVGEADDWMASLGIPAVTAELTTHDGIEFQKNLDGIKAVLSYYKKSS